jgi:hypothetical protein
MYFPADSGNLDAFAGDIGAATFAGHPIAPQALVASNSCNAATGHPLSDGCNRLRHGSCKNEQRKRGDGA